MAANSTIGLLRGRSQLRNLEIAISIPLVGLIKFERMPRRRLSRKIVLERRKGGAKLVSDINLIPRKDRRRLLGRFLRPRKAAKKAA